MYDSLRIYALEITHVHISTQDLLVESPIEVGVQQAATAAHQHRHCSSDLDAYS